MDSWFSGFKKEKISLSNNGFGEVNITCRHGGEGEPLLLLHGNPMSHVTWHKIIDDLKNQFYIVASDLRGYGERMEPKKEGQNHITYSSREMEADQIRLMAKLGLKKSRVFGIIKGVRLAHQMCLNFQTKIKKVGTLEIWQNNQIWMVQKKIGLCLNGIGY